MWSLCLASSTQLVFSFHPCNMLPVFYSFLCWLIFHCMTTLYFAYRVIHLLMEFVLFPLFGFYEECVLFYISSSIRIRHRYRLPFGTNYLSFFWWILSINFQQLQFSVTFVWDLPCLDMKVMFPSWFGAHVWIWRAISKCSIFSLWPMII